MVNEKVTRKIDTLVLAFVFLLLLVNTIGRSQLGSFHIVSDWSLRITFFLMFFLLMKGWFDQTRYEVSLMRVYLSFALLMGIFTLSFVTNGNADLLSFIEFLFFLFFILSAIRMKWQPSQIKLAGYIFGAVIIFSFIHWGVSGAPTQLYSGIYRYANFFGVLLFCILYFQILSFTYSVKFERVFFGIILLLNIVLIFATNSRAVWIGIIVSIGAWIVLKWSEKWFPYLIYIVMLGNFLFVGLYVGIKNTAIGDKLNEWSISISNKEFFTGRSDIWEATFAVIVEKPWFGHGFGIRVPDVTNSTLTAHNMYIQLLLEIGVVGLIAFLLFIFMIWNVLKKRLHHNVAKWSACFMLGTLVYQSLELSLFQNNYSIAVFLWMIMTMGIGFEEDGGTGASSERDKRRLRRN